MSELYFPELSYLITGICFRAHNSLGRYAKEHQYGNHIEQALSESGVPFIREFPIAGTRDRIDFLIDNKVIVELKSKRYMLKADYFQTQRYLHLADIRLALLINFRNRHLRPIRIIKSERLPGSPLPTINVE
jgi:GxxExxY protein